MPIFPTAHTQEPEEESESEETKAARLEEEERMRLEEERAELKSRKKKFERQCSKNLLLANCEIQDYQPLLDSDR